MLTRHQVYITYCFLEKGKQLRLSAGVLRLVFVFCFLIIYFLNCPLVLPWSARARRTALVWPLEVSGVRRGKVSTRGALARCWLLWQAPGPQTFSRSPCTSPPLTPAGSSCFTFLLNLAISLAIFSLKNCWTHTAESRGHPKPGTCTRGRSSGLLCCCQLRSPGSQGSAPGVTELAG